MKCPSCAADVPPPNRFCGVCGLPVGSTRDELAETLAIGDKAPSSTPSKHTISSSGSIDDGRFLPGTLLAGRYRIIGLLGRGGMGEVYRASDLTLGQAVALKFLPEGTMQDETALARFHNEVRTARQVSHPNVCRVYDIGQVDGLTYLSMEYVDGEDLGSLLRRIGRVPHDKAIEMARKLCAGLAAAHEKGVLHRDLKPANIMIDGRGQVLITDFGLAGIAEDIQSTDIRQGTPAYMSPEQLTGKAVTVRSDIYALGLVLYEMFTGKRAFDANTLADLVRLRQETTPTSLTTLIRDLDPAVERVVFRCLETDPKNRPGSALAVAAALPGGDPLAAALAAGETPSPEMVAAAGPCEVMRPAVAIACLAGVLLGLTGVIFVRDQTTAPMRSELEIPPVVLAQKAREMESNFGYADRQGDTAYTFQFSGDVSKFLRESVARPIPADHRPVVVRFEYRSSPRYLAANGFGSPGEVTKYDPPPVMSGMRSLELDGHGRLLSFHAVPPQLEQSPGSPAQVEWKTLFAAAGLDMSRFQTAPPKWVPLVGFDDRVAWVETAQPIALRVEAAAWRGKPVYFDVIGPWSRAGRMEPLQHNFGERLNLILGVILILVLVIGACFVARHNTRKGRGDRRGASRVAAYVFAVYVFAWMLSAHHVVAPGELLMIVHAVVLFAGIAGMVGLLYVAVEPYVRRHWPNAVVSWTRILTGRAKDPVVKTHLLIGVLFGVLWSLVTAIAIVVLKGRPGTALEEVSKDALLGFTHVVSAFVSVLPNAALSVMVFFFLLFVVRVRMRRERLAAIVFVAIFTVMASLVSPNPLLLLPFNLVQFTALAFVLTRFGIVSTFVGIVVSNLLLGFPLTTDLSAWYAGPAIFAVVLIAVAAVYAFRGAIAGRPLFREELLD